MESEPLTGGHSAIKPVSQMQPIAKSSGRQVDISKRVIYADFAARKTVGGGNVTALNAANLHGTPVWMIDVSSHGKVSRVVVRQVDDVVLSTQLLT